MFSFIPFGLSSWTIVRTILLILLTTALGGTWTLEQPNGSLLEFYPLFRMMMRSIYECGGPNAVPSLFMGRVFILFVIGNISDLNKKSNLSTFINLRFRAHPGVRWSGWHGGWGITMPQHPRGIMDTPIHVKSSNWTVAAFRCLGANPKVIVSKQQWDTPIVMAKEDIKEQNIWGPQRTLIVYSVKLLFIDFLFRHGHLNKRHIY